MREVPLYSTWRAFSALVPSWHTSKPYNLTSL